MKVQINPKTGKRFVPAGGKKKLNDVSEALIKILDKRLVEREVGIIHESDMSLG